MDETGVFWQSLPYNGFGKKGKQCYEEKKSKRHVTLVFFVTAFCKNKNLF